MSPYYNRCAIYVSRETFVLGRMAVLSIWFPAIPAGAGVTASRAAGVGKVTGALVYV